MQATELAAALRGLKSVPRKVQKETIPLPDGGSIDVYLHELSAGQRDLLLLAFQSRPADEIAAFTIAMTAHDADGEPLFPLQRSKEFPDGIDEKGVPIFAEGVIDDLKAIGSSRLFGAFTAANRVNAMQTVIPGKTDAEGN